LSTRELILAKLKKDNDMPSGEPTKTSKIVSVVFDGSLSKESEGKKGMEIPPEPVTCHGTRPLITRMLSDGPRPYADVLQAVGGDEDALREAIRGWDELAAFDKEGTWYWEIVTDPVTLAERIGIRYEQEIPTPQGLGGLGKPVFTYRGHVLAWRADPPHIRLYAWATTALYPGRPLAVDIEPTARLLELTPQEVREALGRLVREGDLVRTRERGRELFRLNVRYSENRSTTSDGREGGSHAAGD